MRKKSLLLVLSMMIISLWTLVACSDGTNSKVNFTQSEIIVSQDEPINFFEYLDLGEVKENEITFTFGNDDLIVTEEGGYKSSLQGGQTTVFATKQGKVLAQAKLIVKYKFSVPKNITINQEGVLSWENSFVYNGSSIQQASEYIVNIDGQDIPVTGNSLLIDEQGEYIVQIRAKGIDNQYIDDSDFSEEKEIYFQVVPKVENVRFTPNSSFGYSNGEVSWDPSNYMGIQARYNVYFGGIKIAEDLESTSVQIDLSNFKAGQSIDIEIEAFISNSNILSSIRKFPVSKLQKPEIQYSNGMLNWESVPNAGGYKISYTNKLNPSIYGVLAESDNQSILKGLPNGIYEIYVQSFGNLNENGIFVSSESTKFECAKLENPEISYTIEGNKLKLNFSDDDYIKNYTIVYAGNTVSHNVADGLNKIIDLSMLEEGEYTVEIFATPTLSNGVVLPWQREGVESSSNVLNADAKVITIYKLNRLESVLHTLDADGNSILTFEQIKNADLYTVTVNGERIVFEDVDSVFNPEEDRYEISLNIGKLSLKKVDKYNIEIEASRKDGNVIKTSTNKELSILPTVKAETKESQENGYFKWQTIGDNAKYFYEIYKLDGLYELGSLDLTNAISSITPITGETTDTVITEEIKDFGYYYIRVYSRVKEDSLLDRYLNSDFNDEHGFYHTIFTVQNKLDSPTLTFGFNESSSSYALTIPYVQYSDRYFISIMHNGEIIQDTLYNSTGADRVYLFSSNSFSEEGIYNISVIANSGEVKPEDKDGVFLDVLHPNSEMGNVLVEKLDSPSYTVSDNLTLTVEMLSHTSDIIITKGGQRVNKENENQIDLSEIDGDLTFQFVAEDDDKTDSNYYLDSNPITYTFSRATRPTELRYSKGKLLYNCAVENYIDHYNVEITLVNPDNPDYTIVAKANKGEEFELQQFIQDEIKENEQFRSEYEQWSKLKNGAIEIRVIAYKLSNVEIDGKEVFMLPSLFATTTTGEEKLSLVQLEAPQITDYNTETRILSWQAVGGTSGVTTYDIFVGGDKVEINTLGTSYDFKLKDIQFDTAKEVTVVAYNDSYLSFASSKPITIKRLARVESVNVKQSGEVYFTLPLTGVKQVECNGQEVSLNKTTGYVSFNLQDFERDGFANISLKVIAGNKEGSVYYEDSVITSFIFENIEGKLIESTIKEGLLSWTNVAPDFAGVNTNPVTYTITINKESPTLITGVTENKYLLNSEELYDLAMGTYSLNIKVVISDYLISGENCKGYYGSLSSDDFSVEKLESLNESEITLTLIEDESLRITQRKVNADIKLSWTDKWHRDLTFDIIINQKQLKNIKVGDIGNDYRLELSENVFTLILKQNVYFTVGDNEFKIAVNADNAISSNQAKKIITKYPTVSSASIDENGLLTIDGESGDYAISIIYNDCIVSKQVTGNEIDIMELLQESKGRYTFEVVRFDSSNSALPSQGIYANSGYRLQGINNIEIKNTGDVEISLFNENEIDENIVFVAQYNDNVLVFSPKRAGTSSIFKYSLMDFINLFNIESETNGINIEVSVRKEDCVNADWNTITFNYSSQENGIAYTRGRNYNEDYIKISEIENVATTAIRFKLDYIGEMQQNTIEQIYLASELEGYWITTEEGGYFTKEKPVDIKAERCFGLSINSLLSEVNNGQVTITISRITLDEEIFTQYNSITISDINKLKKVEGVAIRDGVLTWRNSDEINATGYYIYFYIQNGDTLKQSFYKHVTTAFLDLKTLTDIEAGTNYYIRVVTVSSLEKYIGSDETTAVRAMKYNAPSKVQVTGGRIVFDEASVKNSDFLTAISTYYGSDRFLSVIATTTFKSLFNFSATSIASARIRFRFTDTRNNTYFATVNGYDLLPDLSQFSFINSEGESLNYLDAIENQIRGISDTSEFKRNIQAMLNILKKVNGLAHNDILFDDFGRGIPSGEYSITLCQTGLDNIGTITSDYQIENCKGSVTAAPTIKFGTEKDENNKVNYLVTFDRVNITTIEDGNVVTRAANNYVLYMVGNKQRYFFEIINTEGDSGVNYVLKTSSGEIPLMYNPSNNTLTLNVTKALLPLDGKDFIERSTYNFTIYASGDEYAINGKTDMKTLSLLDIKSENISLVNGRLSWAVDAEYNSSSTKVTIKRKNYSATEIEVPFVDNRAELYLSNAGEYDYIILSLLGSYGNSSMSVDSDSYMIKNLYKLQNISVSVTDNHFTIIDQNGDMGASYEIYNNLDGQGKAEHKSENEYWATNYDASEYFFLKLGSSGEFEKSSLEEGDFGKGADYLLSITDLNQVILASDTISQKVIFLNSVNDIKLNNGNLTWVAGDEREVALPEGCEIVYEITAGVINGDVLEVKQTLYTSNTFIDTLLFTDLPEEGEFKFTVQTFAYQVTDGSGDIITVEGKNYLKTEIYIEESIDDEMVRKAVLAGERTASDKYTRSTLPTITSTKGNLEWNKVGELSYGIRNADGEEISLDSLTYANNPYNLFIYSYKKGVSTEIKSKLVAVTLSDSNRIYKLPQIEREDFVLIEKGNDVEIDLSNLYNNKKILGTDKYYKVRLTVNLDGKEYTALSYSNNKNNNFTLKFADEGFHADGQIIDGQIITLPKEYSSLKLIFQVLDNQDETQYIMTLNGNEIVYDISPLQWHSNDKVSWNEEKMQFEWTYGNTSSESAQEDEIGTYMYKVKVHYSNNRIEEKEVVTNFYQPCTLGTITKVEVWVKKNANSIYSISSISLSQNINFSIFAGGDGSEKSPYQIRTQEQFENIKYRNREDLKYYFTQVSNLQLDIQGFGLDEPFYGVYNGYYNGNKTITLNLLPVINNAITQKFTTSTSQSINVEFNNFAALFKQIGASGEVKNLILDLNFNGVSLNENALFAGVAITNWGVINNVTINSLTSNYSLSSSGAADTIAQAGLVGMNYGKISNCENNAEVGVRVAYNYSQKIIVSGLVLSNEKQLGIKGNISDSFNNGNIIVTNTRANSRIWASGIVINNMGDILRCGNNGDIQTINNTQGTFTSYLSGVSINNDNSTLSYCFNNGVISVGKNGSTNFIGGIAYIVKSGRISGLVDTTEMSLNIKIINTCMESIRQDDRCYASNGNASITTYPIGEVELDCGESKILKVSLSDDGYKAEII